MFNIVSCCLLGLVTQTNGSTQPIVNVNEKSATASDLALYARLSEEKWHRVIEQNDAGVVVLAASFSFAEIWQKSNTTQEAASESTITKAWHELRMPLPDPNITCWAYAFTYPKHREEIDIEKTFRFLKNGPAIGMFRDIPYRPTLDYEAEIGVLMHRDESDRFGYVLVNDLTDRGMQVRTHDKNNPAEGFSNAKSFPGSLQVGPLLAIGDARAWESLSVELAVNGQVRQEVHARNCLLKPRTIHTELFQEEPQHEWIFASTGTGAGVVFHTPNVLQKIGLLIRSGFSVSKATERWLDKLTFLKAGDRIEFSSPQLGMSSSVVGETNDEV